MTKKIGLFGSESSTNELLRLMSASEFCGELTRVFCENTDGLNSDELGRLTSKTESLIKDREIEVVIELTQNPELAYQVVKESLAKGKFVISTNTAMIAAHINEVTEWDDVYKGAFWYQAALGSGSMPILKTIEEDFQYQEINSIRGMLSGSTNWVLTEMQNNRVGLKEALSTFHETSGEGESLDLTGKSEADQLVVLAQLAFGQTISDFDQIRVESISNMEDHFYDLAAQQGLKIKSIATAYLKNGALQLKVQPELISKEDALYHEEYDSTALILEGTNQTKVLTGKGNRHQETEKAVLNDLREILNGGIYNKRSNGRLQISA